MSSVSLILARSCPGNPGCPVTAGIPFAPGQAPAGSQFFLRDADGNPCALQVKVLARWPDRSIRWLLIDTRTNQARGDRPWTLHWGQATEDKLSDPDAPAGIDPERHAVTNSQLTLAFIPGGCLAIDNRWGMELELNVSGRKARGRIDKVTTETSGPLRATVLGTGAFYDHSGNRLFGLRLRISRFAASGRMRIEPMIQFDAEKGLFHRIRELNCRIFPLDSMATSTVYVAGDGTQHRLDGRNAARLYQRDDQYACVEGDKESPCGQRSPGWAILETKEGQPLSIAIKDFWQQWPKSIECDGHGVIFGLLPRFEKGAFSHLQPDHKYQYLFTGNAYRLRTGQSCRWELWLEPGSRAADLAAFVESPPVLAAAAQHAIDSGQWGLIAPQDQTTTRFDRWADKLFAAFEDDTKAQRDYGQMNYGDWYGERVVNWGNNEYDTPNQLFVQFVRTAAPAYFDAGLRAARHMSEVDVVNYTNADLAAHFHEHYIHPHYPVRPGMVHEHTLGHVSGYFSSEKVRRLFLANGIGSGNKFPYLCLDPYNLGHIWTMGMTRAYFLTGDPWFKEVVERIGDNLAQLVEDREMLFAGPTETHSGRQNGWTLLALAGVYMLNRRRRYLAAMKTLAEDKLSEQDPVCGGWLYELPLGHCMCTTRKHVGEAGFLTAIMVNALSVYYRLSGDQRIPEAIRRAIDNLNTTTWDERQAGWRYTSCPASFFHGQFGTTMEALANSVAITGSAEHRRILEKAWQTKFDTLQTQLADANHSIHDGGMGKIYTSMLLGCAEVVAALAARIDDRPGDERSGRL